MKQQTAEKARVLLQKIKVAKIQLSCLKEVTGKTTVTFNGGASNSKHIFYFSEESEKGNGEVVEHIKNAAIEFMEQKVKKLEQYLEDLSDD